MPTLLIPSRSCLMPTLETSSAILPAGPAGHRKREGGADCRGSYVNTNEAQSEIEKSCPWKFRALFAYRPACGWVAFVFEGEGGGPHCAGAVLE
jgi:hypothetical protein